MLPKKFDHKEMEEKWIKQWEDWGIYRFDPNSEKPVFSIDTPPRYASGYLHMGHAKNYIEFEIIARFMRMLGYNVFLPNGYDDNGLPTEKYVEEKLGVKKSDVDRETFINKCKEAAEKLEEDMTNTFKRIGFSCDWSTLYRTISDYAIKTAQHSFIDLYKKGEIYRREEPILWCPHHETALAQAEIEDKVRKTKLNYIYFELEDGRKIEIATTRPELLPSCVGIFVHPEDERYNDLVGKKAIVPIFGQKVPIMTDEKVDMNFGSGIVMICTFGDTTDIEWWRKHNLPMKISINKNGTMNDLAGKYEGMKIEEARKAIIEDLKKEDLIIKQEEITQTVGCCWRCGTPVEFIPTEQWFIKTLEHKEKMIELGRKIKWYPEYYRKRYEDWVKNLKWDWCISRQRYYGVPFPVWYCKECGNIVVAKEEDLPVDPRLQKYKCDKCGSENLEPEMDVMDTWMTSSLTPQITTKWIEDREFFKKMFPMNLRPQAHDIIRTWAFYTILKSYLHENEIPWKDIMVSGYVYVEKGMAMSSSKGIGKSPLKVVEEKGADVLRYWATGASVGEDLIYREKDLVRGQKILIKLWNAARFISLHLDKKPEKANLKVEDRWILSELSRVIKEVEKGYKEYNPNKARRTIENFFKNVYCDFYLEMVKHRLYGEDDESKEAWLLFVESTMMSSRYP